MFRFLSASLLVFTMTSVIHAAPPTPQTQTFALSDVRLLDGPFKQAMVTDEKYLLALEPDRLLAGFRENAGLSPKGQKYGGWESRGLEGHSLGHYLSACSMMYAATGDQACKDKVDYCVKELADCQAAVPDGFLGGMPNGRELFDSIKKADFGTNGGFDLHGAWVPWYNQHKLFAGIRDAFLYTVNEQAKQVLVKLGDWAIGVCANLDDTKMQQMLGVEHGGMNEVLADLYAITKESKYLDLSKRFWQKAVLDPLAAGKDDLTGKHANTQIPKIIGSARLYELTGDEQYRTTADTFWNAVVKNRSFVTGSNSDHEHFFQLGLESKKLGPENGESCNVYNMLKLTSHLAQWTGKSDYYDYYELALFNHILGSIDPDTGMTTYFQSLEPGRFKVYGTPTDSFWCCTGTGMENHAKYGADIYTHAADGSALDVNLFISSELNWKEKGITLRQETSFPESDETKLTVKIAQPIKLALRIRVPKWAEHGIDVSGAATAHGDSGYVTLDRTWNDGDTITVKMLMALHLHRAIDDATMVAAMYGPIVLAAELGRKDFPPSDNVPVHTELERVAQPVVPPLVSDAKDLVWLKPVEGKPLHFETVDAGKPSDLQLMPFYQIHHERYAVYLRLLTTPQYAQEKQKLEAQQKSAAELAARTVDEVAFGQQQPEQDHGLDSKDSRTGSFNNRSWRDATSGGFFSVKVNVKPNTDQLLRLTYWGSDANRTFDILIDGKVIATQTLNNTKPNQFFDVDYPLAASLIGEKSKVTLEFRPHENSTAGGVFGCVVLLKGK